MGRRHNLLTYHKPAQLGDIAYWNGISVATIPLSHWESTMTPIGVVVIPENFLPDGKARIASLHFVRSDGQPGTQYSFMKWSTTSVNTSITDYGAFPTTTNTSDLAESSSNNGYLPIDEVSRTIISYVNPNVLYKDSPYIPSPYLANNTLNPEYCKSLETARGNVFSTFDGLTNTRILVNLGSSYTAANAACNYSDGYTNLQWYLPSIAELGIMVTYRYMLSNILTTIGGTNLSSLGGYASSSEYSSAHVYMLVPITGRVFTTEKSYASMCVRPFAILD